MALSFREFPKPGTGFPRNEFAGNWVAENYGSRKLGGYGVAACVSESPRQGTKKEAGLDLWIMCRRGCQPGNYIRYPLLLPL